MSQEHKTPAYRKTRAAFTKALKAGLIDPTCYRCGYPVDTTLPASHPDGPSMDHTTAISEGGTVDANLEDLAVSHLRCNREHGARLGARTTNQRKRRTTKATTTKTATKSTTRVQRESDDDDRSLRGTLSPPAPPPPDSPRGAQEGPRTAENDSGSFVLPRIETSRHSRCQGSHGADAVAWLKDTFGMVLRPWQAHALERALEYDADRKLIWQTVIVTVSRQSGKSWLARGLAMWRLHHADLFGEEQLLLHVANKTTTAMEVMRPAGMWAEEMYGRGAVRWGNTSPGITLPNGSRWLIHAANESAGVGYSVSMAFVDEAWGIRKPEIVEGSIAPTMAEREQPQLWLVSTAGDGASDLLIRYRERAINTMSDPTNILILEWSAPQDADPDDETTWRWASPEWSDKRANFLRSQHSTINRAEWRTQYLNQWAARVDHWLTDDAWNETRRPELELPDDQTWIVAVESEFDWSSHAVAVAGKNADGVTVIRLTLHSTLKSVDDRLAELRTTHPNMQLRITPGYRDRIADQHYTLVGRTEAVSCTANLLSLFEARKLAHNGDPILLEQFYRSRIARTSVGWSLSSPGGALGVYGARAVMFAVGESTKRQAPRPAVYSRAR